MKPGLLCRVAGSQIFLAIFVKIDILKVTDTGLYERRKIMDLKEITEAKKALEQDILKALNNFELKSDCIVEGISLKRKRIEAGIGSRDALDRVTIRAVLPE